MKQEDLFFNERTGEMEFARPKPPQRAPRVRQAKVAGGKPIDVPGPSKPPAAPVPRRKPRLPPPAPAPPPDLVVPATHREMVAQLLKTTRKMCRHLRREQLGSGLPSQFERGERIVALIERLDRGEAVAIDKALEVESMASLLWMASTRDNPQTGRDEYHCLSFHAAEVMDWALRCAIGRRAVEGFAAACQRFAEFMREP